jgi:Ras GTPase-activating-like protein IQGAP2/3
LLQTVVFTLFGDQFDEKEENLLLQLFECVLVKEYEACPNIGEFMRSNTAFTKMLSTVLKRSQYHHYLLTVLTQPIQTILQEKDLNLEINPAKVYSELVADCKTKGIQFDGPETVTLNEAAQHKQVKELIEPRIDQIRHYVKIFLNQIFAEVSDAPYGVRFMCKKIFEHGQQRFGNKGLVFSDIASDETNDSSTSANTGATEQEVYGLVGGLVFLRYLNPAISTCDTPAVNIVNQKLTTAQRKNLTMICKVIQSLSNGVLFGSKEQYMIPLNNVIIDYIPYMKKYFESLINYEDDMADRMEMDQFVELSQDTKHINISYNEVVLLHKLCDDNMNTIAPLPNDPVRNMVIQLRKMGQAPDTVHAKDNYYFNMRLKNPENPDVFIVKDEQALKKTVRASISSILRDLPTLPSESFHDFSLSDVLKAGQTRALDQEDKEFANRIKQGMELLQKVQDMEGGLDSHNETILKDIFQDLENKAKIKQESDKKLALLMKVLNDVQAKRAYLNSQLDMYNQYFANALSKTFSNTSGTDSKMIGPYSYKLKELIKQQIVVDCTMDKMAVKATKINFSSKIAGKIDVTVYNEGKKLADVELDLNELLEKQSKKDKKLLQFDKEIKVNVDSLILLVNKLFVVEKERRGTKLKKISKRKKSSPNLKASSSSSGNNLHGQM